MNGGESSLDSFISRLLELPVLQHLELRRRALVGVRSHRPRHRPTCPATKPQSTSLKMTLTSVSLFALQLYCAPFDCLIFLRMISHSSWPCYRTLFPIHIPWHIVAGGRQRIHSDQSTRATASGRVFSRGPVSVQRGIDHRLPPPYHEDHSRYIYLNALKLTIHVPYCLFVSLHLSWTRTRFDQE